MLRFAALREYLRSSLWFIPLSFTVASILLAELLLTLDTRFPSGGAVFGGTAEGARSILSTIAQSMLSFTALVFTVTMLVLQLASSQLSPRVMRTFLRDRGNQVVLGLFVATFVYTLVVLRDIRTPVDGGEGFVPGIAVTAAFVLLLASVAAFIYYIDHMAHAIRATTVMDSIANETFAAMDRLFPDVRGAGIVEDISAEPYPGSTSDVRAEGWGVVVAVDESALLELAAVDDRAVRLVPTVGDAISRGAPLFQLSGQWNGPDTDRLRQTVSLGQERTLQQDVAFGIRQLVDIALRALSSGINDPTTAVQALDRIEEVLRRLAARQFPSPLRCDAAGLPRLWMAWPTWASYLELATDEIRLAGAGQPLVARRLRTMLEDVAAVAPAERRLATWAVMHRLERRSAQRPGRTPATDPVPHSRGRSTIAS